jgi:hypothetical protein
MLTYPDNMNPGLIECAYLGGPMSGYHNYNFKQFNNVAKILRMDGFTVINPAETAGGCQDLSHARYMRIDIGYLMNCDALFLLPGWRASRGAKIEAVVAAAIDIPIFEFQEWNMRWREIKGINLSATELVEMEYL